jgi:hypothetical protein
VKSDHPVHFAREPLVVRGDQRRAALAAHQAEELPEHGVRGVLVEVPGRLVGEDQRRLVRERACNRDSLLLAAGQLGRTVV